MSDSSLRQGIDALHRFNIVVAFGVSCSLTEQRTSYHVALSRMTDRYWEGKPSDVPTSNNDLSARHQTQPGSQSGAFALLVRASSASKPLPSPKGQLRPKPQPSGATASVSKVNNERRAFSAISRR